MSQSGHKTVPLLRIFRKYPVTDGAINIFVPTGLEEGARVQ